MHFVFIFSTHAGQFYTLTVSLCRYLRLKISLIPSLNLIKTSRNGRNVTTLIRYFSKHLPRLNAEYASKRGHSISFVDHSALNSSTVLSLNQRQLSVHFVHFVLATRLQHRTTSILSSSSRPVTISSLSI